AGLRGSVPPCRPACPGSSPRPHTRWTAVPDRRRRRCRYRRRYRPDPTALRGSPRRSPPLPRGSRHGWASSRSPPEPARRCPRFSLRSRSSSALLVLLAVLAHGLPPLAALLRGLLGDGLSLDLLLLHGLALASLALKHLLLGLRAGSGHVPDDHVLLGHGPGVRGQPVDEDAEREVDAAEAEDQR